MVFFCSFVVGFCGLDFIFEVSECDGFAIGGDFGDELLFAGVEAYTFIFRVGVFSFFGVAIVLGPACGAEVCLSIIETVMVDVVNDVAGRNFNYTAMHVNWGGCFSCWGVAFGVEGVAIFGNVPFVFVERFEILGINDGKFALCKWYATERIAVVKAAIEKEQANTRLLQPYRDVEGNLDFPPSGERI